MKIGYARISTCDQTLDLQLDALQAAGCQRIFSDTGISGAATERKGLSEALAAIQRGDSMVVWKLDRLGRSLKFLINLIDRFEAGGCGFVSLTDGIDTTTPGGKLVFHVIGALAEFERALISERTVAGLNAARARGKRIGRPRSLTAAQVQEALYQVTEGTPVSIVARDFAVSDDTLARSFARLKHVA